jgi:hypothetical protein
MPALKAERTAFSWPRVNVISLKFTFFRPSVRGTRFVVRSVKRRADGVKSAPTLGGSLPRRFASSNVTLKSRPLLCGRSGGGFAENVGDFISASEATDWIVRKSIAYFNAPEMTPRSPGELVSNLTCID